MNDSKTLLVIGICGKKGSGKTTIASHIKNNSNTKCIEYAMADPLKDGVSKLFGLTYDQTHGNLKEVVDRRYNVTPRKMLQVIGTEWLRDRLEIDVGIKLKETLWITRFREFVSDIQENTKYATIVVHDVRYVDELEAVLSYPCSKVIFVERKTQSEVKDELSSHKSENTDELRHYLNLKCNNNRWKYIENNSSKENLICAIDTLLIEDWFVN